MSTSCTGLLRIIAACNLPGYHNDLKIKPGDAVLLASQSFTSNPIVAGPCLTVGLRLWTHSRGILSRNLMGVSTIMSQLYATMQ